MVLANILADGSVYVPPVVWATDIAPQIQAFVGSGLIMNTLIAISAITIASIGAKAIIGIFKH